MSFDKGQYDRKVRRATRVEKKWGYEDQIVNKSYCGKVMFIKENHFCSKHMHLSKFESFLISKGKILLEITNLEDGSRETFIMSQGDIYDVPVFTFHRFIAIEGDAEIIEFSTTDAPTDSKRVSPGGSYTPTEIQEKLSKVSGPTHLQRAV